MSETEDQLRADAEMFGGDDRWRRLLEIVTAERDGLREKIAQEIERHPQAAIDDDDDDFGAFTKAMGYAAEIVRAGPCRHDSWAGTRCMGCGSRRGINA